MELTNKTIVIDGVEYNCSPIEKKVDNGFKIQGIDPAGSKIHSVKRTSDGEIFTVGDKITGTMSYEEQPHNKGYTTITGFHLEDDKLCIGISTGIIRNHKHSGLAINTIRKHVEKPVLFTTEDGVGIEVGDRSYGVDTIKNKYTGSYIWEKSEHFSKTSLSPNVKYFSTKIKALQYIENTESNKKVYSKADIIKALGDKDFVGSDYLLEQLERNKNL